MANDLQQYMVPETMWHDIENEINELRQRIANNDDIQPEDVVQVQNLVKQVDDFGTNYTRAINKTSKEYKAYLQYKLKELKYDEITAYIAKRRAEHDKEVTARMTAKIAKLNEIINNELALHPTLAATGLKETLPNLFIGRFPKINSGAVSNEIKNWKPIESVIKTQMDKVEELLNLNPTICFLPIYSQTFQTLARYFRSGDINILASIPEVFKTDADLLRNIIIKQQMSTSDDLLKLVSDVMASTVDNETKIKQIKQLLLIWDTL